MVKVWLVAWVCILLAIGLVVAQRGSSLHWPMAFVAKGHADEWNATSIVYYDWKQRAMRRDTLLVYPPAHYNPESLQVEFTKQPSISSFIWRDVCLSIFLSVLSPFFVIFLSFLSFLPFFFPLSLLSICVLCVSPFTINNVV